MIWGSGILGLGWVGPNCFHIRGGRTGKKWTWTRASVFHHIPWQHPCPWVWPSPCSRAQGWSGSGKSSQSAAFELLAQPRAFQGPQRRGAHWITSFTSAMWWVWVWRIFRGAYIREENSVTSLIIKEFCISIVPLILYH